MPNKRVRYFKLIEEISDKFVYVLDKDLLGFESEDVYTFHFHLWKMKKFNLSENFILMDDDYFIGKPINKSQFFYYDEEEKKVVPSVATDSINELNKDEVVKEYKKLLRRVNYNTHSFFGWKLQQLAAHKLLLDNFNPPLINGDFSHNAIPLNLNDLEEIYKFIEEKYPYAKEATKLLLGYIKETQKIDMKHISNIEYYNTTKYMVLDSIARRNLEITETIRDRSKRGSLLWVIDKTSTSMGGRLLRKWVEKPLMDIEEINRRLDAVEELKSAGMKRGELVEALKKVYDIERLTGKVAYGTVNAKD